MARKPYYCGRCGGRFHTASKYCPACGAILSLPLGSRSRAADEPAGFADALRRSGWLEVSIIMVLLFFALYLGLRAIRARSAEVEYTVVTEVQYVDIIDNTIYARGKISEIVPADKLKEYDPPTMIYGLSPEHEKQYKNLTLDQVRAKVARGELGPAPVKDRIGGSAEDVDVNIKLGIEDNRSAGSGDNGDSMDSLAERLAANTGDQREPAIEIGMTQQQVSGIWGQPLNRQGPYSRDSEYYERWYYGDSVYNIDVGTRYVEFGPDRRVVMVRDGDIVLREPPRKQAASGSSR
jgi:hypothetical protein